MSTVAIPAMKKYNYHPLLNAGSVAAGATLGVLIPPSIVLVVYGLYTGQSIGKLFFGNVIPSAILTTLIAATVVLSAGAIPTGGRPGRRADGKSVSGASRGNRHPRAVRHYHVCPVHRCVTATEAAAVSCFLALVICGVRRKLTWKKLGGAFIDTLRISCMVFMIVAGAADLRQVPDRHETACRDRGMDQRLSSSRIGWCSG